MSLTSRPTRSNRAVYKLVIKFKDRISYNADYNNVLIAGNDLSWVGKIP